MRGYFDVVYSWCGRAPLRRGGHNRSEPVIMRNRREPVMMRSQLRNRSNRAIGCVLLYAGQRKTEVMLSFHVARGASYYFWQVTGYRLPPLAG